MSLGPLSRKPLEVVVIDDVCRFALYVWRYLSRCIGFGTGLIPNDGGETSPFWRGGAPHPLTTPGHDARVWWVNANGWVEGKDWSEQLKTVLNTIGKSPNRCFLVDVRGPYGSSEAGSRTLTEDPEKVMEVLSDPAWNIKLSRDVLLVSSYHTAPRAFNVGRPLRIHPKSPETLEKLCERLSMPWGSEACPAPRSTATHILVTGAGFEFRDSSQEFLRLGTRLTNNILEKSLSGIFPDGMASGASGFPYPKRYNRIRRSSVTKVAGRLLKAANDADLDRYWDELLMLELLKTMSGPGSRRRPDKRPASEREYALRDSFRRQFLADDWGFLSQALDALKIPGLAAWLTTNYTRFADRAVEIKIAHTPEIRSRWRIISTASEAERLAQELLHEPAKKKGGQAEEPRQFLFKLHGDLAHLVTMAIAGHDKEIFSPLSLPISSLHSIYTAAEQCLERRLKQDDGPVFWHIVGHGLKDDLLVRLIHHVCQTTGTARHCFLVVSPSAGQPCSILKKELAATGVNKTAVLPLKLQAHQYLARLRLAGLPDDSQPQALRDWSKTLRPFL
jgi:hypothetical protein